MEFSLKSESAQQAIKLLTVTAKQNTSDYEGQIVIQAENDEVLFLSNNGNSGLSCRFPAEVKTPGKTSVIFSKIKTFIMTFSPWDGEVGVKKFNFKLNDTKLRISVRIYNQNGKVNRGTLNLETQKPSSFISEITPESPNLILNSNTIKAAIDKSIHAIDINSLQDFVRGLRLFIDDGNIYFTSTNGSVVSDYVVANDSALEDGEYFLSHEFLSGLRRLSIDDTQFFFELSKTKNILSYDNIIYWARSTMYKEYPQYQVVFSDFDIDFEVDRISILDGLSSMETSWHPEDHNRLTIEQNDNVLTIKTESSVFEYPEMEKSLEFSVDVDGRDFLNTLRSMNSDLVTIKISNKIKGVTVESNQIEKHKSFLICLTRR